ncbi:MAG: hypothetical protein AAGF12_15140 [Myxococcota bacterium]
MERAEKRAKARARALRAARVVTIAAALIAPACSSSHVDEGPADATADRTIMPDSRIPDATVTPDGRIPDAMIPDGNVPDGNIPDANVPDRNIPDARVDANICPPPTFDDCCDENLTKECCENGIGFWDEGQECCSVCVIGPLVPPSMIA